MNRSVSHRAHSHSKYRSPENFLSKYMAADDYALTPTPGPSSPKLVSWPLDNVGGRGQPIAYDWDSYMNAPSRTSRSSHLAEAPTESSSYEPLTDIKSQLNPAQLVDGTSRMPSDIDFDGVRCENRGCQQISALMAQVHALQESEKKWRAKVREIQSVVAMTEAQLSAFRQWTIDQLNELEGRKHKR